ncbi:MAG: response regulator [Anaerolineae bacterium]|nr:response regulator [Anaerolineae bacterium]MCB9105036.1 response regulator [Anaerolineales bacterium]
MNDPIHILYVDDYPFDRELVRDALEKEQEGFRVTEAASRADFEARLVEGGYDLVLSDFNILGFEGLQVLDAVRARNLNVPVIIVTGTGSEEVAVEAMKRGAADYVIKTARHIRRLPHTIHAVMEKKQGDDERKRAQEALRRSEAQLSNATMIARLGYWEYDVAEKLFTFNDHFFAIFHTSVEQVGGYKLSPARYAERFLHPDDMPVVVTEITKALETTDPDYSRQLEHRIIYADGGVGYSSVRLFIIKDNQGRTIKVYGANQDITERKRSEEALRESESKYRTLVENIPQKIFTKDRASVYVSCNENFARDLGIKPDHCAGRTDYDFFPNELADKYRADDQRIMETGQTEELEEKYVQAGQETWVQTIKTPIRQEDGRVIGILGIFWDITKRIQAEAERERLQLQLNQAQKMESIGRLAGGIAHDFNNLLVSIIGYAELGMLNITPDDQLYANFKRIKEGGERAADLTRQILAFSRQQVLEIKQLDLNQVINEFVPMLRRLISEDIALQTRLADNLPPLKADKGQLEQVLMNLVVNARDAMPDGGTLIIDTAYVAPDEASVDKYLKGARPGPQVLLTVSDTGNGIDIELQPHIFEPFFTTKARGQGTGLGLATVFGIIKQHQGNIEVYSEPGQGTTFEIYLPVADAPISTEKVVAPNTRIVPGTETVLVVEDEAGVRQLVGDALRLHGYYVLIAEDPLGGLNLAATYEGPIDLLLTDVIMPHMNGRALYRQLAMVRPGLKVLYMSGYTDDVIAFQGVLDPGVAFLQKPFAIRDLLQKVRGVLG